VNFIVSIRIEAAETVIPFSVGKIAADRVGPEVFQENHAVWQRIFGFISETTPWTVRSCASFLDPGQVAVSTKKKRSVKIPAKVRRVFHFGSPAFAGLLLYQLKRQALLNIRHVSGNHLRLVLVVLLVNDHFIFSMPSGNPNGKFAPGVSLPSSRKPRRLLQSRKLIRK